MKYVVVILVMFCCSAFANSFDGSCSYDGSNEYVSNIKLETNTQAIEGAEISLSIAGQLPPSGATGRYWDISGKIVKVESSDECGKVSVLPVECTKLTLSPNTVMRASQKLGGGTEVSPIQLVLGRTTSSGGDVSLKVKGSSGSFVGFITSPGCTGNFFNLIDGFSVAGLGNRIEPHEQAWLDPNDMAVQHLPLGSTITFPSGFEILRYSTSLNGYLANHRGGYNVSYSDSYLSNPDYYRYSCYAHSNLSQYSEVVKNPAGLKFVVAYVKDDKPYPRNTSVELVGRSGPIKDITCECIDAERNGPCPFRLSNFQKFLESQNIGLRIPSKQRALK